MRAAVRPAKAHPPHPNPLPRGERGFQMRLPGLWGRLSPRAIRCAAFIADFLSTTSLFGAPQHGQ
ncbi:hypothetical protein D3867_25800 (plasmid) [Azospirillum argentinense]|uniref:Uncharacterized protein n=1 Tax=Azospirillum brasilense TaxID=192 RepID=A0A4D8Q7Z6_AZOBR|nr:hypothetical protein D3867_25800 [Azospirillum argentinense]